MSQRRLHQEGVCGVKQGVRMGEKGGGYTESERRRLHSQKSSTTCQK